MAVWRIYRLLAVAGSLLLGIAAPLGGAHAQCGAYGDPIINMTFGNAANPMSTLPAGVTTYSLHPTGDFMMPDHYMITNNAANGSPGQSGSYHNLSDHTGDPGGQMLLVNASWDAGIFYTATVEGLCPNTDFRFSAWIVNVSPAVMASCGPSLPVQVEFEIQTLAGETLGVLPTPVIHGSSNPQWAEHEVLFNTGENTDVRLIMRNLGEGGCGNNLAIDDIQFSPCGPATHLLPQDIAIEVDTVFLCVSSNYVTFNSEIGAGYTTEVYQWQQRVGVDGDWQDMPGETDSTLTVEPAHDTWYRLAVASTLESMANPQCRVASAPMRAAHARLPVIPVSAVERQTCVGVALPLDPGDYVGPDVGPLTYQWYRHHGDGNWEEIPGATTQRYDPDVSAPGVAYYQRRGINVCGYDFPINAYTVTVEAWQDTEFVSPVATVCLDDAPFLLTGGTPLLFNGDQPGVYSGSGVSNGYFNPAMAGIGDHQITYAPAPSVFCPVPSTVVIRVVEPVEVDPMEDRFILPGRSVRLHVRDNNGVAYQWDNVSTLDRPDQPNPMASPAVSTTYSVTVTNAGGCEATETVRVHVLEHLDIPNTFTPNGDQINDVWEIRGLDLYPDAHVRVYNRWGTTVYTSEGYNQPWDGRFNASELPAATYYYIISSSVLDKPLTGAITILR